MGNQLACKMEEENDTSLQNITSFLLRCEHESLYNNEGLGKSFIVGS